jgi:acrylyl-CoA reductase (NADPH)
VIVFKAILVDKDENGHAAALAEVDDSRLPEGDVTVRVDYSSLNYKDGLLITGRIPLISQFPMVPGIDLTGTVEASDHPDWRPGDKVVLNGYGLGERHWGGLAQRARVRGDWLVPLPEAFSARQAMAIGTAGYAAMLCVLALERHGIRPSDGEILITGASGGVGSVALAILSRLGYSVVAVTGRTAETRYLTALGAAEVMDRALFASPGAPMQAERWAGAIDTAGSHTLVNVCASVRYGGAVAATGLAHGLDFPATVLPFVLRNLALYGVDSVMAPKALRLRAWERLARDLDPDKLESMIHDVRLSEVVGLAPEILAGRVRGRIVVDVWQ